MCTWRGSLAAVHDQSTCARVYPVSSAARSATTSEPGNAVNALPRYHTSCASLPAVTGSIHSTFRSAAHAS